MNWDERINELIGEYNRDPIRNDSRLHLRIKSLVQEICNNSDTTRHKLERANKGKAGAACMLEFLKAAEEITIGPRNHLTMKSYLTINILREVISAPFIKQEKYTPEAI